MKIVILRGGATAIGNGCGAWVLVNLTPAVAHQLDTDSGLCRGLVDAEPRTVVLTDAQIDHVGGLLSLRDGVPIDLYATPAVFEQLTTTLPVLPMLQHYCGVHWHVIAVAGDDALAPLRVDAMPGIEFTAIATQLPVPPHSRHVEQSRVGDSIALAVRDLASGQRLFCAPGLTRIGSTAYDWMREADCLLVDIPTAPAADDRDDAAASWLEMLRAMPARHKVLLSGGRTVQQRLALAGQGIALAYDGMEIAL